MAYGVFGGLPGQLSLLDADLSLAENVVRQILDTAVQSRIDSGQILLFTQSDLFPT